MFEIVEIKEVKIAIGQFIKSVRKKRKISEVELGEILDVSRTTIQNMESGKNFTIDNLLKVLKEFDLLEFLIRHKGTVCRRTQIIEKVWDIHFEYDTGVIDVYINALRKKLHLKTEEDYIQTVRGVGYIAKD